MQLAGPFLYWHNRTFGWNGGYNKESNEDTVWKSNMEELAIGKSSMIGYS